MCINIFLTLATPPSVPVPCLFYCHVSTVLYPLCIAMFSRSLCLLDSGYGKTQTPLLMSVDLASMTEILQENITAHFPFPVSGHTELIPALHGALYIE